MSIISNLLCKYEALDYDNLTEGEFTYDDVVDEFGPYDSDEHFKNFEIAAKKLGVKIDDIVAVSEESTNVEKIFDKLKKGVKPTRLSGFVLDGGGTADLYNINDNKVIITEDGFGFVVMYLSMESRAKLLKTQTKKSTIKSKVLSDSVLDYLKPSKGALSELDKYAEVINSIADTSDSGYPFISHGIKNVSYPLKVPMKKAVDELSTATKIIGEDIGDGDVRFDINDKLRLTIFKNGDWFTDIRNHPSLVIRLV